MARNTPNFTIHEEDEPISPHRRHHQPRPRSSGSSRRPPVRSPTLLAAPQPAAALSQVAYAITSSNHRILAPVPATLRGQMPQRHPRNTAQSFLPQNQNQPQTLNYNPNVRPIGLAQRSSHSLVINRPLSQRVNRRHPQPLQMDHRPPSAPSEYRNLLSPSRASNDARPRTSQRRHSSRTSLGRRPSNRKARRGSSRLRNSQHPPISARPPKMQQCLQNVSYSSDDTCLSYPTNTSKATTNTAVGSPVLSAKPSCLSKHPPSLYVKEFTTPGIFQSRVDLGPFSKRKSDSRKQASGRIYWIIYVCGFLFFPAWVIGYAAASLALGSLPIRRDPERTLLDATPNPLHSRWKTRFLNTLLIFTAVSVIVTVVVIIAHPSWFPYKSKIMSIGKH